MKLHSFTVLPTTPPKLKPLLELANNMWYAWNREARQLFVKIDEGVWDKCGKNPTRMLCSLNQKQLEEAAKDENYLTEVETVYSTFKNYLESNTWFDGQHGTREKAVYAYFCCEYGIHESLPIYSGGLGILAGDHLKSASDLGVPLVAIGLLYRQGYFRQGLSTDGMQQEFYPENDWFQMPVAIVNEKDGKPLTLSIQMGEDLIYYHVWLVKVGRVSLYLLDTNLTMNNEHHRDITKRLYDADRDVRIRQEILLGIGGVKALHALGFTPHAYHINEGHSAFLLIERMRELMQEQKLSFEEAKEVVWSSTVFTTHTPVPAGNERFSTHLVEKYLKKHVSELGVTWDQFLGYGRENPEDEKEDFCMTVFALKYAALANGVAALHGSVSRDMWKGIFPEILHHELPIKHVTNGVHSRSWQSAAFERLFMRYSESAYTREIADFNLWKVAPIVPDVELWQTHIERKKGLIKYVRTRLKKQLIRQGASASEISRIDEILNPSYLTIGFARRFAPYKRATLLFKDIERLRRIVANADRPVQFIFAGKAHPADTHGKDLIKQIFGKQSDPAFQNRIIFLEDYDIEMAKFLVKGVDVWLNTPRRPLEASGTSGMKAAMNGAINLSILDGWWDEAYQPEIGWAIGMGINIQDEKIQDEVDANTLYRLIENDVAPMYYERDEFNVPTRWVRMMKASMKYCGEHFNAHRMLIDYIDDYYTKAEKYHQLLVANKFSGAKELAQWRKRLEGGWDLVEFVEVIAPSQQESIYSGSNVHIKARIRLNSIRSDDVKVEVYHGILDQDHNIGASSRIQMVKENESDGIVNFKADIPCEHGGRYGFTVRVLPGHEKLICEFIPKMVKWAW